MAHFNICVLVKNDSNLNLVDLAREKAWPLLDKFMQSEVPPYKMYIEAEDVSRMKNHYKTDDLQELATKLEDWNGYQGGGVDDGGLYAMSTSNPNEHYDSWDLLDEVVPSDFGRMLFGESDEYRPCGAIITPDGTWLEGRWIQAATPEETNQRWAAWDAQMKQVLSEHKDCTALLADCHF